MIIFVYGPDSWQGLEKVKGFKDKFMAEVDQSGDAYVSLVGKELNIGKLNDLLASNSLFVRKRMIVIKDILSVDKKFLAELAEYLPTLSKSDHIIIFHETSVVNKKKKNLFEPITYDSSGKEKKLNKEQKVLFSFLQQQQYVQYYGLLTDQEALTWVKNKLAKAELKLEYQAGQLLIGIVGNDLWSLNNETDKLVAYKQAQKNDTIVISDIEELVRGILDHGIFALTDALSNKDKKQAVKLLSEQISLGVADQYLLTMLVRQFRILLKIRQGLDSGLSTSELGKVVKVHPYVLQKGINQVRNFNLVSLKNIFNTLARVDYNYKTGRLNVETMVDLMIARF